MVGHVPGGGCRLSDQRRYVLLPGAVIVAAVLPVHQRGVRQLTVGVLLLQVFQLLLAEGRNLHDPPKGGGRIRVDSDFGKFRGCRVVRSRICGHAVIVEGTRLFRGWGEGTGGFPLQSSRALRGRLRAAVPLVSHQAAGAGQRVEGSGLISDNILPVLHYSDEGGNSLCFGLMQRVSLYRSPASIRPFTSLIFQLLYTWQLFLVGSIAWPVLTM